MPHARLARRVAAPPAGAAMRRALAALGALGALAALQPGALLAQGYRVAFDLRAQRAAFRGWRSDSVLASSVVSGAGGGTFTPDGYAADCGAVTAYCFFFRPGDRQLGAPLATTTDLTLWGLGVQGLSVRANWRMHLDLADPVWPGTEPNVQLWEGYADFTRAWYTVRAGRQQVTSRFGFTGFDGGLGAARWRQLDVRVYGGWGLARAASLPIDNKTVLDPLGEFRPPLRHLVVGAVAGWSGTVADVRAEWLREVDRDTRNFISERAALSGVLRPARHLAITGGGEYDLAQGWFGSADASIRYTSRAVTASAGWRRYRPHFDLWTVWPAFSPVPYNGANASLTVTPVRGLALRGRGEYWTYDRTAAETPLSSAVGDGWRWSGGVTVTRLPRWTFDAGYSYDRGAGAAGWGWDAQVGWQPVRAVRLSAFASRLFRPLEFRYDDNAVRSFGGDVEWRAGRQLSLGLQAVQLREDRRRPDAAAFDWDQTRLSARVSWVFASDGADRLGLPRAIRRMPSATGQTK